MYIMYIYICMYVTKFHAVQRPVFKQKTSRDTNQHVRIGRKIQQRQELGIKDPHLARAAG